MKHIKFLFVSLFSIVALDAFSVTLDPIIGPTITLHIKITDSNVMKLKEPFLMITTSNYPISGLQLLSSAQKTTYRQDIKFNGSNTFIIPSPQNKMYLHISCSKRTGSKRSIFNALDNVYIINSGSVINCTIGENGFAFSGSGSKMLNLQNELIRLNYQPNYSIYRMVELRKYLKYFNLRNVQADSVLKVQLKLLKKHKSDLNKTDYQILVANCYGYRYYWEIYAYNLEAQQNEIYLDSLKRFYSGKKKLGGIPLLSDSILTLSPNYSNYLVEELNMLGKMNQSNYYSVPEHSFISNVLLDIKRKYVGILKDKLLAMFLMRMINSPAVLGFYESTFDVIKSDYYKHMLQEFMEPLTKGQPFKDFKLFGEDSKIYSLADFKNKIVVMDFWYTGCVNCSILKDAMKPVYDHYKENNKVVFVSVSIDKSKEMWIQSLAGGKYTHDGSVNLFTNGEGQDNELIKFYNISGYPTLKVIKNGILFSAIPPKPTIGVQPGLTISRGATELIETIDEALK
ncbi:TlpA family protein disulfide reductase [Pedobacter sp. AW31-3R]|uniref:TlpA family protein disulfide reductase n=1 Tax=Pedobacter sp. AW31-3R TaxID=3445781 RepID=UPI003F9F399A